MSRIAILGSRNVPIPPIRGGAIEHWVVNVTRALQEHSFLILSPADPDLPMHEEQGHIRYERIRENKFYQKVADVLHWDPYSYLQKAAKIIREFQADIVHLFNVPLGMAAIRNVLPKAKIILHCMNTYEQIGKRSRGSANGEAGADLFIACSQFLADTERKRLANQTNRIEVVTNGADLDRFQPWWASDFREQIRSSAGLQDKQVILFSGRLTASKGIDRLVKAMSFILKDKPNVVLLILGSKGFGVQGQAENEFTRDLRQLCEPLGEAIRFQGFIPPEEVHHQYAAADLFCHPVRWQEPFALAVCEAAACGLPVIATDSGGTPELIEHNVSGVLMPVDSNPEAWAQNCMKVLDNAELSREIGEEARKRILQKHHWQAISTSMNTLYKDLLT